LNTHGRQKQTIYYWSAKIYMKLHARVCWTVYSNSKKIKQSNSI